MLSGNISDDEMLPPTDKLNHRRSVKSSTQSAANEIIKAYQVTSFKYVGSKYENRGKVGLALIGFKSIGNFSVLLYGKGNAALAQASINKDFEVTSGRDLYISFYDVKSENWSILFDTLDIYNDFLTRISILKLMASKQDCIVLDVKSGEGAVAHDADLCEAEIVINGVKNCEIVSCLYSSESQETNKIVRLKIGANKLLLAIDKALLGMMKGGHRIIAVSCQNSLLKGGSIKVANDLGICAQVKVLRIKTKTDRPITNNDSGDSELSLPNLNFNKEINNETTENSKKLELLKRMEKMGKPILGFHLTEENRQNLSNSSEATLPEKNLQPNPTYVLEHDFVQRQPVISNAPFYDRPAYNTQIMPLHTLNPMMTSMQQMYQPLPSTVPTLGPDCTLVFTETRQHNTEMRIAISKLQDKIDRITDKFDNINPSQKPSPSRHMDAENVFENIKRIIDENEILKQECSQKSNTIDQQNQRINELLNKSQKHLEESRNVMDRNSATLSSTESENQKIILKLEEEKLDLIRNLSKKTSELSNLEMRGESLQSESQNYRSKSLEFNEQLNKITTEFEDLKLKNRSLSTELEKIKEDRTNITIINEELQNSKVLSMENERKLQNSIEILRNNVKEANNKAEQAKKECDNEVIEIRKLCNDEIEDLRNKLKLERRMINSRSSTLETEIDCVNKEWEKKFDELRLAESAKLVKINERNTQLMMENTNFSHEIFELKDQLSLANNSKNIKFEELVSNNRQLQRQLDNVNQNSQELDRLNRENNDLKKDISRLSTNAVKIMELKNDLELTANKNQQLESRIKILTEEINVKSLIATNAPSNDVNNEQHIKNIMNDIFKNIKLEFQLDKSYNGKYINNRCMIIIRDSTVSLMQTKKEDDDTADESSESDDSDEESIDDGNNIEEVLHKPDYLTHDSKTDLSFDFSKPLDEATDEFGGETEHCVIEDNVECDSSQINKGEGQFEIAEKEELISANNEVVLSGKDINEDDVVLISQENETEFEGYVTEISEKDELISENENGLPTEKHINEDTVVLISEEKETNVEYLETTVLKTEETKEEKSEISISICEKEELKQSNQMIDNVSNDPKLDLENEHYEVKNTMNDSLSNNSKIDLVVEQATVSTGDDNKKPLKDKKDDFLFSSDEDNDVSGFFEQLNQKKEKQAKNEKSKPNSTDVDDELSWLHS